MNEKTIKRIMSYDPNSKNFKEFQELKEKKTVFNFCKTCGISQPAVWKWLNTGAIPRLRNLETLADYIGGTVGDAVAIIKYAQLIKAYGGSIPEAFILEIGALEKEYTELVNKNLNKTSQV